MLLSEGQHIGWAGGTGEGQRPALLLTPLFSPRMSNAQLEPGEDVHGLAQAADTALPAMRSPREEVLNLLSSLFASVLL